MKETHLIDRPIFVIGCNRSGTTLLFRNFSEHPSTWSLYEESQEFFYRFHPIDPEAGDRLADPPSLKEKAELAEKFFRSAHNKEFFRDSAVLKYVPRKALQRWVNPLYKRAPIRLVEKTPANCFRIPYLAALFKDALFIFIVRRPEDTISSLMEGWKNWSNTKDDDWHYTQWHYLVPPGWREWTGRSLQEICTFQWVESTSIAWQDLDRFCAGRYLLVRHEETISDAQSAYQAILDFCALPPSAYFERLLERTGKRVFTHGGSHPRPEKWRELHEKEIELVRHMFQPLCDRLYPVA